MIQYGVLVANVALFPLSVPGQLVIARWNIIGLGPSIGSMARCGHKIIRLGRDHVLRQELQYHRSYRTVGMSHYEIATTLHVCKPIEKKETF